jgi:cold shock CspA family protein
MKLSQLASQSESARDAEPLPSAMTQRYQGAIRRLKEGYGFVACDDGHDYFFHWTAMEATGPGFKDLTLLQRVEFNLALGGPKGPRAICMRVLG